MATSQVQRVVQHLRQIIASGTGNGETDGQLLERFIARRDDDAFAAMVGRHGPMVLGVCRRLLPRHHDAEDAFQATFLVLVRKAAAVVPRDMLANWLYGVAYHTALKARALTVRRQAREKQVTAMPEPEMVVPEPGPELRRLLDKELNHLPDIYRVPIVCCDLEGKSRQEAARQLGWSEGTLSGRLSRARALLAKRLTQRGLTLSAGSLAAALSREAASAGVPYALAISTVRAGSLVAAGHAITGAISVQVAALTEGVLHTMWLTKLKITTALLATVCAVAIGGGGFAYRTHAAGHAGGATAGVFSARPADGIGAQEPTEQERLEKLLRQFEESRKALEPTERARVEKLVQQLDEEIRKAQEQTEQARLEKLRQQLDEQIRKAQVEQQPTEQERLQHALKQLREVLQKVRNDEEGRRAEVQKKVRDGAVAAQREIDKVLEGVRKANDKKTEIEILEEIEKAVKEMKRKAQAQPDEKQPAKAPQ
jgi:RNA polymerase sigma factor (sigma-70 family)